MSYQELRAPDSCGWIRAELNVELRHGPFDAWLAHFGLSSYASPKAWEILVSLYSDMSLDDLTVLKNWLLTRIEATASMSALLKKSEGADRIKELQEQLLEVEAEIALKEKLH